MANGPFHLLFIEDNADYVHLIREEIASCQGSLERFRLESAGSLGEAKVRLLAGGIDLILLDLALPDRDGLDTLAEILGTTSEIPVVVLTARDDPKLALESVRQGAQDYLVKGQFDGKRLTQILRNAIERKQREQRLLKKAADIEQSKERLAETHRTLIEEISKRQAAEERERMEREKLDRMKEDFISTVSHELRTPLTIIAGAITNLEDGIAGKLTKEQAKVVETASRSVERLTRLIDDLLDLSRLASGKARVNRCHIDLPRHLQQVVKALKTASEGKKLTFRIDFPRNSPPLFADPDLLDQVLTNLLNNALRFAKREVVVRASRGKDGFFKVSVLDDGPGIPKEKMADLFNKFVQIDRPAGGGGYKGTGLGLAICKEIVERHDGRIWAESKIGHGAEFHFTLPLRKGNSKP